VRSSDLAAFLILATSGIVQASFALPVKYIRRWRWEQLWVAQSLTANILLPGIWAALLPAAFWEQARTIGAERWLGLYAWGIAWGIGGVAYGLTLTRLGASFAYSFVFGGTTVAGALLPLAFGMVEAPAHLSRFAAGLALSVLATAGAALAARGQAGEPDPMPMPVRPPSYAGALVLAVIAGLFSAGYGLAYAQESPAVNAMVTAGFSPLSAPMLVALPVYAGAASFAIPFGLVCAGRSRSLALFVAASSPRNWALALAMAAFGVGGVVLYGAGSAGGRVLPNIAFGIYMSFFVLGGNAIGVFTGELRARSRRANWILTASIAGLICGAWLLRASQV
jgi:L-rhamnose-H+ transport protein